MKKKEDNPSASTVPTSKVSFITVPDEYSGQRLDNFLLSKIKGIPKSLLYRIIRKGEIRVNKGRKKPEYKIIGGDEIRVPPIKVEVSTEKKQKIAKNIDIKKNIIYENKNLIIINKPSGMAVHGGSGISLGLIELLRASITNVKLLELVHRLDRETSGCVMVAKKRSMLVGLHELLRDNHSNNIEKIYHAVIKGSPTKNKFIVKNKLKKIENKFGDRKVIVDNSGKDSCTEFEVLENLPNNYKLIMAKPITGRMHQIRVHLACSGFPIVGDTKYGGEKFNRMLLHARSLKFVCPLTEELIAVQAEYDQIMKDFLYGK